MKRGVLAEMEKLVFFLLMQELKIMQAREGRREGIDQATVSFRKSQAVPLSLLQSKSCNTSVWKPIFFSRGTARGEREMLLIAPTACAVDYLQRQRIIIAKISAALTLA